MTEFTGERVIPGQVNDDLWAEHIARYAFAARFAAGKRVLDIGCGTGYGTAELAKLAASATGIDLSNEAVAYAREHFPGPTFLEAPAQKLPFSEAAFDLVTAFEVIEHLEDWAKLLAEASRVLTPEGLLLVSTPNTLYYAESRAKQGPNPYHHHEFAFEEFRVALKTHFAHAAVLFQDRVETFAFYGADGATDARIDRNGGAAAEANFFLGIASNEPLPDLRNFLYVPTAGNLLREREQHIALLEQELATKEQWLRDVTADRDALLERHRHLKDHLDHQNQWALGLEASLKTAAGRIDSLGQELDETRARFAERAAELEEQNQTSTRWALNLEQQLNAKTAELAHAVKLLDQAEATVIERTEWAQGLSRNVDQLRTLLAQVSQSRWVSLGRAIGLGPKLGPESE